MLYILILRTERPRQGANERTALLRRSRIRCGRSRTTSGLSSLAIAVRPSRKEPPRGYSRPPCGVEWSSFHTHVT